MVWFIIVVWFNELPNHLEAAVLNQKPCNLINGCLFQPGTIAFFTWENRKQKHFIGFNLCIHQREGKLDLYCFFKPSGRKGIRSQKLFSHYLEGKEIHALWTVSLILVLLSYNPILRKWIFESEFFSLKNTELKNDWKVEHTFYIFPLKTRFKTTDKNAVKSLWNSC